MARVVIAHSLGSRTVEFVVETTIPVANREELHDALTSALPAVRTEALRTLKDALWDSFLEHYDVIQAVWDQPEPEDYTGEGDGSDPRPAD